MMFFLPWWTYVLIGTVAFTCAFSAVWLAGLAFDRETDNEPMPCMAHTGTERDGTELWCWQKYGHSGAHDDYSAPDGAIEGLRRLLGCPEPTCLFDVDHEGPHMCWEEVGEPGARCVLAKGHEGEHNPFADHDDWDHVHKFDHPDETGVWCLCGAEEDDPRS
jgi:hypothetical protein